MKHSPLDRRTVKYRLSALCFAMPLASVVGAVLIQGGIGILGLALCFLASPAVFVALFFKLPFTIKHAMGSFLVGFVLAVGIFVLIASANLSGQNSPWFN